MFNLCFFCLMNVDENKLEDDEEEEERR